MNGDKPVVTIIVADTGDEAGRAARLARSTKSVQNQSLRGVQMLVANERLSGKTALAEATGEFVLFLTAGNVLDRHAARAAVAAAEEADAELVSGRWTRPAGKPLPDRQPTFRRTDVYARITDRPDLLHDTLLDNKLMRTRFAQRNPLGFAGSDGAAASLGFVTAAYVQANGIVVMPQRMVIDYVGPEQPDPAELLDVHMALDRLLAADGVSPEVVAAKNARFLEADLPRYLLTADLATDDARRALEPLRGYLDSLGAGAFTRASKLVQIAVFMVRHDDVEGARSAAAYLQHDRLLKEPLVERGGRVYWTDRHLDSDEGRATQDVTMLGFQELPWTELRPGTSIRELQVRGRTATIRGHTVNPLGRIPTQQSRLELRVGPAEARRRVTAPAQLVEQTADGFTWQATLHLPRRSVPARRSLADSPVELSITAGTMSAVVPVSAGRSSTPAAGLRSRLSRRVDDDEPLGRPADAVVLTGSLRTKARVLRFVLARLPQRRRSVVFESHMGLGYSDNPRYVSEELQRRAAGFHVVWSFAAQPAGVPHAVPPGVRTVRRTSWRHIFALARAEFWVDNQGLPQAIQKPDRVTYLQTWHGSALKRMGEDTPGFARMPPERQQRHRRAVQRWDYFVARSEHDVRTLVPAMHVRGEVLRTGYPRNDPLVQLRSAEQRAAVRAELGLPADKTLVLYAPTFRETYASGLQDFELPIDLDRFFDELPDHRLLVRTHYLQRLQLPAATHAAVRDVSSVPDITPLLVAADVLVTDYSSVLFDFANTGRPMVFYVYDYDDYAHSERGVYWELAEKAPGPLVRTGDELISTLASAQSWLSDYEAKYRDFVAEFGEYDTGTAARQIVDRVFLGPADGK